MNATIVVLLPNTNENFIIALATDTIYGFPILSRVDPSPPLPTQTPISMQYICWMVALNPKKSGYVAPFTAKFCIDELRQCQDSQAEVRVQILFIRKSS